MAVLLAILIWVICLAISVPFFTRSIPFFIPELWFPEAITDHGRRFDSQFMLTLVVTGVIFILAHFALGYTVMKFGGKRSGPADYFEGNERWEILWTIAATVLFIGLTFMGYSAWAEVRFAEAKSAPPDPNRVIVEVTGQQFVWNMRYPGPDGKFGPLDIKLINDAMGNPLGIDRTHPDGKDDITVPRMTVPVGQEVEVVLRTKDVLHNFFVPELRIKLDTVPGLVGSLRFRPDKVGTYEIPCSELCGLGHYKMRSFMDVVEPAQYEAWLQEQATYLQ